MSSNLGRGKMSNMDMLQAILFLCAAMVVVVVVLAMANNFLQAKLVKGRQSTAALETNLEKSLHAAKQQSPRPTATEVSLETKFESYKTEVEEEMAMVDERFKALANLLSQDSTMFRDTDVALKEEVKALKSQIELLMKRPAQTLPPSPIQFSPLKFEPLRINMVHYQPKKKPVVKKVKKQQ